MLVTCPSCQSKVTLAATPDSWAVCESCGGTVRSESGAADLSVDISVVQRNASPAVVITDSTLMIRAAIGNAAAEGSPGANAKAMDAPAPDAPAPDMANPNLAVAQLLAKRTIGPYVLESLLGQGGFGVVLLAQHQIHGRKEAVKVPLRERFRSDVELKEFLREAQIAVQLDHPHLVPIYQADYAPDGTPYIAMKYIDGVTLTSVLRDGQTWPLAQVVRMLIDVAEALHHAHVREFVHRDLKPGNILIDRSGKAWVSDFGLALHASEQLKVRGDTAGTLRYSSPEQIRGHSEHMDGRTDIYSFGVILYELLTKRPLFEGNRDEIEDQIQRRAPVPPSQRDARNEVPLELEALCLACLEKEVSKRPSSMSQVAKSLRNWLATAAPEQCVEPNGGASPLADAPTSRPPIGSQRPDVISVATLVAAAAASDVDATTVRAADADTDRTVQPAPVKRTARPKLVALSGFGAALLLLAAAGVAWNRPAQNGPLLLMDTTSGSGAPVRLLNSEFFRPAPLVMPPRENDFTRIHDGRLETLKLDSPGMCAVFLGQVDRLMDWKVQVPFQKSTPFGNAGFCWGFQPVPAGSIEERHTGGEPAWRLQIIWYEYQSPDRIFLRRRIEYFRKTGDTYQAMASVGLGAHAISLADQPMQQLGLAFHGPHLGEVLWNGNLVPLDDVNLLVVNNELPTTMGIPFPLINKGPFGVVDAHGSTTFERIEFQNLGVQSP